MENSGVLFELHRYLVQFFTGYFSLDVSTRLPSSQRLNMKYSHLFTPTNLTGVFVALSQILGLVTRQPPLNSQMAIQVCRTSGGVSVYPDNFHFY